MRNDVPAANPNVILNRGTRGGEGSMDDDKKSTIDRRTFLKGAAASAGAAAATVLAQAPEAARPEAPPKESGKKKKDRPGPGDIVIDRPGSDFMVDVIKTLDLEYISTNPGSSFRSIHESLVNYGKNAKPELLTCMHEEAAIAMAHGYAKAAGKPMGAIIHGTVGLQHGSMAIYNA